LVSFSVLVNDSYNEDTSFSFFNITDFETQNSLQITSGNPIIFPAPPNVGTVPTILSAVGTLFTTSPVISLQHLGVFYASQIDEPIVNPFTFTFNLKQLA